MIPLLRIFRWVKVTPDCCGVLFLGTVTVYGKYKTNNKLLGQECRLTSGALPDAHHFVG